MNEDMKVAWLEISDMLGEPTEEDFDVFMRTWQRASQATRKALAEPKYIAFMDIPQRTWVGLTDEEIDKAWRSVDYTVPWEQHRIDVARAIEAKLREKNNG